MEYQAILITAYKDFDHLEEIIRFFEGPFRLYIHIDKKIEVPRKVLMSLEGFSQVVMISRKYKVNWGSHNHVLAILELVKEALKDPANYYFHLISGLDFPIKTQDYFISFFNENRNKDFLDFFDMPRPGWADNEGMDRLQYYNFYCWLNSKIYTQNVWIKRLVDFQRKMGIKRGFNSTIPKLYGGSTWWSLSRRSLNHVHEFTKNNPAYLARFKHTLCAEEFYFQTILLNSPFADSVVNNNLRFIDWVARNGNKPAVLDESDYERILKNDSVFARKFEKPTSYKLFKKIQELVMIEH